MRVSISPLTSRGVYAQGSAWRLAARRSLASAQGPGIRVWASDLGESAEFDPGRLQAEGGWVDYVKGVVFSLAEQGHTVDAVDLVITAIVELPSNNFRFPFQPEHLFKAIYPTNAC